MSKIIITRKPIKALTKSGDSSTMEKKRTKKSSVTFDNEDGQMTTTETVKDLSSRWGKAAKYIVKGIPPVIPEFAPLWEKGMSAEDPYYDILCREFSYGFFPENMYFDQHRGVVILSKYVKKKITKKSAKNTSAEFVCTTLFGDTLERTTVNRSVKGTNIKKDTEVDVNDNSNTVANMNTMDETIFMECEHSNDQAILDIINRGVSRGEFLVRELVAAGISHHQLFMELKYYLYKVAGILSPSDANKLRQKEEMKNTLMKEANECNHVSWKKQHIVEKETHWLKFVMRKVPGISRHKLKFLLSWFHVIFLKGDYEVQFVNKAIKDIPGLEFDESGNIVCFQCENRAKKVAKEFEYILGKYNGFQMTKFWSKICDANVEPEPTMEEAEIIE